MVNSFDSIKNCIPQTHSTERHLWVTDKQGKVQWINRKSYSCLRQNGRLQVAFGSIKNLVDGLPKIDTAAAEKIQLLSNLKKQITNKYLNFSKAHRTPLFGYLYRLLFARSLDSNYKAALLSIDTYLKNHISKLSVDEFKTFISFFKPEEAVSYLSLLDEEALNRLAPHLPDEHLVKLEASQIAKLQLDKFTSKQICLIKDKLTIQQLNKLDLSQWPHEDVTNLYTSKNVVSAACIKTINPIGWSFVDLKLFLMKGLHSYSKNVNTINWPFDLKTQLRKDAVFCNWASIYIKLRNDLLDFPLNLLATITDFNSNAIHRLALVSNKALKAFQSQEWIRSYFQKLKANISKDKFDELKERFPDIQFSNRQCIDKLNQYIYQELKERGIIPSKGIMSPNQLANYINFLDDCNFVCFAGEVFRQQEIVEEIGVDKNNAISQTRKKLKNQEGTRLTQMRLVAQYMREEFAKITPETLLKVRKLDLDGTFLPMKLTSIPKEVFFFKELQILLLDNNKLTNIPSQIGTLTKLTTLRLGSNKLTSLPKEFTLLTDLKELSIPINKLTSLPKEFTLLTDLKELSIHHNQFSTIPKEITALSKLTTLIFNFPKHIVNSNTKIWQFNPMRYGLRHGTMSLCLKKILEELDKHKFENDNSRLNFIYSTDFDKFIKGTLLKYNISGIAL